MIEGFKIDVPSEVKARLEAQAAEHQEKADRYRAQAEGSSPAGTFSESYQTNDPRQALLGKYTEHSNKAALFRFMAEHVVPAVTYRPSESDLIRLGVIDRW